MTCFRKASTIFHNYHSAHGRGDISGSNTIINCVITHRSCAREYFSSPPKHFLLQSPSCCSGLTASISATVCQSLPLTRRQHFCYSLPVATLDSPPEFLLQSASRSLGLATTLLQSASRYLGLATSISATLCQSLLWTRHQHFCYSLPVAPLDSPPAFPNF